MAELVKSQIENLETLMTRAYESEKGYEAAADNIDNEYIAHMFRSFARERHYFHQHIEREIRKLGGEATPSTSLKGDLHRTWMNLKATITGGDEETVLEECRRGEEVMFEDYQEVLDKNILPPSSTVLIKDEQIKVKQKLQNIEQLMLVHA